MTVALLAALSMVVQDILATLLTQAEARDKAILAGVLDSVAWMAAITTTSISVTVLQGHDLKAKILVVLCVTAANFIGTTMGTLIGKRYIKGAAPDPRSRLR